MLIYLSHSSLKEALQTNAFSIGEMLSIGCAIYKRRSLLQVNLCKELLSSVSKLGGIELSML